MDEKREISQYDVDLERAQQQRAKWHWDHEAALARLRHERGWVGSLIGIGDGAKVNAAFAVIAFSFLFLAYPFFFGVQESSLVSEAIKTSWDVLPPLITLALGYLFGKQTLAPKE